MHHRIWHWATHHASSLRPALALFFLPVLVACNRYFFGPARWATACSVLLTVTVADRYALRLFEVTVELDIRCLPWCFCCFLCLFSPLQICRFRSGYPARVNMVSASVMQATAEFRFGASAA
jgi:hypothetical protein